MVVIEIATGDWYFARNKAATTLGGSNTNARDGIIRSSGNDWIRDSFTNYNVNGIDYIDILKSSPGNRLIFAQSAFDWKIQAVSSYENIAVKFHEGIVLDPFTTNTTGSVNAENGKLIVSGSGADQHIYCYLNGAWSQLD